MGNINFKAIATENTPTPASDGFSDKICENNGGINCSILRDDASITCNDGTVDDAYIIYSIPQCQKTIGDIVNQQSKFMADSGCLPPSEMTCVSDQSYINLWKKLNASELADSELGKSELTQCRQQIKDYAAKNKNFKQCLAINGNSKFSLPTNRLLQPMIKALFCPIFYGNNSFYDDGADLCVCDNNYFMSGGKCVEASLICRSIYGSNVYAQNGNCLIAKSTLTQKPAEQIPTPLVNNITPLPSTSQMPSMSRDGSGLDPVRLKLVQGGESPEATSQKEENQEGLNPFKTVFRAILSFFRNIFKT